jgi:aspartate kinase
MKTESGIAARMFRILSDRGINIQMISTSPIRISCVVDGASIDEAVTALHGGLGLDEDSI